MKGSKFTSLLVALAFCTAIFAVVQTEMRMHVFSNGDNGMNIVKALTDVDSVKFMNDTLEFKVSFVNWDGTELQSGILQSGSMPEYKGAKDPEREQTAKCTYAFKGWTPEIEEVQSEATYTADYDSTINKYIVVFMAQSGDILLTDYIDYGAMPNYTGELPTKENTKLYDYTFVWKPEIAEVTGNVTYKADFDSTKHKYTCIFNDYNGKELVKTEDTYDYVLAMQPTRSEDSDYTYEFKEWSLDESRIEDNILVYTAVYDSIPNTKRNGALIKASYKVTSAKSVYFSQGNLQFTTQGSHKTADSTAKGTWRFAENQYDYIGSANSKISETYEGWIDLFGWGTSGWNSKATCYQPWSTTLTNSYYYPGGSSSNDLTGTYANADWGVYNAISNGGNEPNKWRTLTTSEWQYLFKNNKWTLGYIKTTEKDSSLCFMLIPETFTAPEGITVTALSTTTTSTYLKGLTVPSTNKYTTEQFASLEKLGVVALPCGGFRFGTSMRNVGSRGNYWSSSAYDSYDAYGFYFYSTYVDSYYYGNRTYGRSVRLVQDVQ